MAVSLIGAAAVALGFWMFLGAGPLNYDGAYALLWGSQIADGHRPEVQVALAPTPKPLLIAFGVVLDRLGVGHRSAAVLLLISVGSLGWLAAAAGAVAWQLAGWWAALLSAAIIVTREPVVSWALRGYSEVLFCALLLSVLALELRRCRAGLAGLMLLSIAGLLRPEAWLLSIAYLAWCWPALGSRSRVAGVVLASGSPLLWVTFDVIASGVPWWSLTGTRQSAQALARPTGLQALVLVAPRRIGEILREPVLVAAVAGIAVLVVRRGRNARVMVSAICAVSVGFSLLALTGLPVIARYLLPVASLLAVVAAVGVVRSLDHRGPLALRLAGYVLAGWMAVATPGQIHRLTATSAVLETQRQIVGELHGLADTGRLTWSCRPLSLPNRRAVPSIAWWTRSSPFALRTDAHDPSSNGTVLIASRTARRLYALDRRDSVTSRAGAPQGFTIRSSGRFWAVADRC